MWKTEVQEKLPHFNFLSYFLKLETCCWIEGTELNTSPAPRLIYDFASREPLPTVIAEIWDKSENSVSYFVDLSTSIPRLGTSISWYFNKSEMFGTVGNSKLSDQVQFFRHESTMI